MFEIPRIVYIFVLSYFLLVFITAWLNDCIFYTLHIARAKSILSSFTLLLFSYDFFVNMLKYTDTHTQTYIITRAFVYYFARNAM